MTVSLDTTGYVSEESSEDDINVTYTPTGTLTGIVVIITHRNTTNFQPTACAYGGVSMSLVGGNQTGGGENGYSYMYFLGDASAIAGRSGNVVVGTVAGAVTRDVGIYGLNSAGDVDTEIVDSFSHFSTADELATFVADMDTLALTGRDSFVCLGAFTGRSSAAGCTPLSGWISDHESAGWSGNGCVHYHYNTIGSTNVTIGLDFGGVDDDVAIVAVAVAEAASSPITIEVPPGGTPY